jgi:hypothetical protein
MSCSCPAIESAAVVGDGLPAGVVDVHRKPIARHGKAMGAVKLCHQSSMRLAREHSFKYRLLRWLTMAVILLSLLSCAERSDVTPQSAAVRGDPSPTASLVRKAEPRTVRLSALSGRWTGKDTLIVAGTCMLSGGPEPVNEVTNTVNMLWEVEDSGETSVRIATWPGAFPYTFTGHVDQDLTVHLALSTTAGCGSGVHEYTANYEGVIEVVGHLADVNLRATEVWCPGSCVFDRVYSIHKAASLL